MTSALTKLDPHCPFCLVEAKIGDPPRTVYREDFVNDLPESATRPRNLTCWNCGKDYTARFYERQGVSTDA